MILYSYNYNINIFYYVILSIIRLLTIIFFFSSRRRHTRFSRDWSSDVCSSDLVHGGQTAASRAMRSAGPRAYPMRRPARPQVLVKLRTTTTPERSRRADREAGSPGTVSANASSTPWTRPGRASAATVAAG